VILEVSRASRLSGVIRPPSEKSLTHRAYMFGAIATGPSIVRQPLMGEDCEASLRCLQQMGLSVKRDGSETSLFPTTAWHSPNEDLDCGNSGTTMRLMSGLIASRPIRARMVGDASLSRRPMKRIAVPLRLMGAKILGDQPPLEVEGGNLRAIDYTSPVASAQIKSCVLLAGLLAEGTTSVTEPTVSRDHTERMLGAMGVAMRREGTRVEVEGGQQPKGFEMTIPADISSATFLIVAAALLDGTNHMVPAPLAKTSTTGVV